MLPTCHTAGVSAARGGEGTTDRVDVLESKRTMRTRILAARAARSEQDRERAGQALCRIVANQAVVAHARCVAAYVSRGGEPPTRLLLETLSTRGVRILLPIVGGERRLTQGWAAYAGAAHLVEPSPGRPLQPSGPDLGPAEIATADVVLLPALAVDTAGTRLGYGAGWYDRALAYVGLGTLLIALVYQDEVFDAERSPLPRSPHDRAVVGAATPQSWIDFEALPVEDPGGAPA